MHSSPSLHTCKHPFAIWMLCLSSQVCAQLRWGRRGPSGMHRASNARGPVFDSSPKQPSPSSHHAPTRCSLSFVLGGSQRRYMSHRFRQLAWSRDWGNWGMPRAAWQLAMRQLFSASRSMKRFLHMLHCVCRSANTAYSSLLLSCLVPRRLLRAHTFLE